MENLIPHFSPSRSAGNLIFVSGQMPFSSDGSIVPGGIQAQTAQCIANIAAILAKSGLALEHVVKTTVWLARTSDFAEFNTTYAQVFQGTPPARSTVRSDLMMADALVEIEAIALAPATSK